MILDRVDFDENGEINYSEFVSGALDRQLLSKENLWKVYGMLCSNHHSDEVLTEDQLRKAWQRRGEFEKGRFDKMMRQIGLTGAGIITFDRFC